MAAGTPQVRHRVETAGHLAATSVPRARSRDRVADLRCLLRAQRFEAVDLVLVHDDAGRYLGTVPLRRLLEAEDAAPIADLLDPDWPTVPPEADQEQAASIAARTAAVALPVIAASGEPVGVLTPKVLIEVLAAEHREDMDRLVGILRERRGERRSEQRALDDPPLRRFGRRVPWLLAGLALSSIATALMASFEATLQRHVMVAFFIPALVYITDAIGTQTEAVAVRGLSARHSPLQEVLWKELATGLLIGLVLAVVAVLGIWAAFGELAIGLGVGLSLIAAGTLACGIGLMLPWGLSRLGLDPAFGAGPIATIAQDVLTIAVYFLIMTRVIGAAG